MFMFKLFETRYHRVNYSFVFEMNVGSWDHMRTTKLQSSFEFHERFLIALVSVIKPDVIKVYYLNELSNVMETYVIV